MLNDYSGWKSNMGRMLSTFCACMTSSKHKCSETILQLFVPDFTVRYRKRVNAFAVKTKPLNKHKIVQNPEC